MINKYFKIYKPYNVLSQFTDKMNRMTLQSIYNFPKNVYPVGRLDYDSEGLLILTDDKYLTEKLLNPIYKHEREYFVQVEGLPTKADLIKLENGIEIDGKKTLPAKAKFLENIITIPERNPSIRFRKNIPTSWLSIILIEGRNRQIRKMTAKIGFPTLRLIRWRIANITLTNFYPANLEIITEDEIKTLKNLIV